MKDVIHLIVLAQFKKYGESIFFGCEHLSASNQIFFQNVLKNLNDFDSSNPEFWSFSVFNSQLL